MTAHPNASDLRHSLHLMLGAFEAELDQPASAERQFLWVEENASAIQINKWVSRLASSLFVVFSLVL
mgnify:CR=1 FL=1